jgi:hypothetical protein
MYATLLRNETRDATLLSKKNSFSSRMLACFSYLLLSQRKNVNFLFLLQCLGNIRFGIQVITSMKNQGKTKICVLLDSNNSYFMTKELEHTCSILNFADS